MIFEEIAKSLLTKRTFCDILKSHTSETLSACLLQERGDFMEFGEKLKQIRIASHLSQEQLADITGLERKTIARYEMGETIPRYNKVYEKLSEFFKTSIDFWKNDNPDDFQQTAAIAYGADAKMQAQKLLDDAAGLFAGGALSDEDKDAVFNALQKVYWEIKVEKAKKSE